MPGLVLEDIDQDAASVDSRYLDCPAVQGELLASAKQALLSDDWAVTVIDAGVNLVDEYSSWA